MSLMKNTITKTWDELTASQQDEILERENYNGELNEFYHDYMGEEYNFLDEDITSEHNDIVDKFELLWQFSSHGPYLQDYHCLNVEFSNKCPEVIVDVDGEPVKVWASRVYDNPNYEITPDDIEIYVDDILDYSDDEIREYPEVQKYINDIAAKLNEIFKEKWNLINDYCTGDLLSFEEFLENESEYHDLVFEFELDDEGNEIEYIGYKYDN